MRVIEAGALGFGAVTAPAGDWRDAFELAKAVAVHGSRVGASGFCVSSFAAASAPCCPTMVELASAANDLLVLLSKPGYISRAEVTVEFTEEAVAVTDGVRDAEWRGARVAYTCLGVDENGTPMAHVSRTRPVGDSIDTGLVSADLKEQIRNIGEASLPIAPFDYLGFDGALFPAIVRRYLASVLNPERCAYEGGKHGLVISPALRLVHDPALAGVSLSRPFDDEGRAAQTSDLIHDGRIEAYSAGVGVPVAPASGARGFARRKWLSPPAFDLAGIRVFPAVVSEELTLWPTGNGVILSNVAELDYNEYSGTLVGILVRAARTKGDRTEGYLYPGNGVIISVPQLLAGVMAVGAGPPSHGDEGHSPIVVARPETVRIVC